jgi:hypothetical protein
VLAKIVGENNPANAQNMLNTYQVQNQTSQGNYNYNLQQQHEFAKQQLAQQLQENYMKYGQEAVKTPGGLSLLGAQTGGAALGGLDPTQLETNLRASQAATTLEHAGAGAYSAAQAGRDITDDANTATGGLLGPYGTPLSTRNLLIKEANANARHAAGAGDKTKFNIMVDGGVDEQGNPVKMNIPIRMSDTDAQIQAKAGAARNARDLIYPPGAGVAGQTAPTIGGATPPASGSTTRRMPPPPPFVGGTGTNLPNNPNATPPSGGQAGRTPQAASGQTILDPKVQQAARERLKLLPPEARTQVGATMTPGGILQVVPLAGGGIGYVGRDKQIYPMP